MTTVRAAAQSSLDRFVIEFGGPVPQYEVKPQASARFVQDPSGLSVSLDGSAGLSVTVHNAQSHGSYFRAYVLTGPSRLVIDVQQ